MDNEDLFHSLVAAHSTAQRILVKLIDKGPEFEYVFKSGKTLGQMNLLERAQLLLPFIDHLHTVLQEPPFTGEAPSFQAELARLESLI